MPQLTAIIIALYLSVCAADQAEHLESTLYAIENLVKYYNSNYGNMNLDGIYGLRVLEGQMSLLLEAHASGQIHNHTPEWVWKQMTILKASSHNISETSLVMLQQSDPDYFKQMQWLVERPMKFAKDYQKLDATLRWPNHIKKKAVEGMDEQFSDKCMHQLMGSVANNYQKCAVSTDCLVRMLQRGHIEYTITHQLLYTILAEQNGCERELTEHLQSHGISSSMSGFQQDLCTNNFYEVQELLASLQGLVAEVYHDLFMEQLFVCPLLGYMEFLHAEWLSQVLSWQSELGCYGKPSHKASHKHTTRRLLFEKEVEGGCLSHKTAVAAGCLSQFLRFLVNPGSPDYQLYAHIDGINHLATVPAAIGGQKQQLEEDEEEEEEVQLRQRLRLRDGDLQAAQEDEEDNANDYYEQEEEEDEEDDEEEGEEIDEDEDDASDKRKLPVINLPPNEPAFAIGQQDEEYKQYIDDDQEETEQQGKQIIKAPKFFQDGNNEQVREVNDDVYNYYEENKSHQQQALESLLVTTTTLRTDPDSASWIGPSYFIVLSLMIIVLVIMYRFIRKRRVLIRYRYR